jgi:hypothetical protein
LKGDAPGAGPELRLARRPAGVRATFRSGDGQSPQESALPKVTFIEHSGTTCTVNATSGSLLMQAALENSVPSIDAGCSGTCACGYP